MLKKIYDTLRALVTLALDLQRTRDEAKEMRQELNRLTDAVLRLTYDFQRLEERERLEREKFALETEVRLLKSERTREKLPKQTATDDDEMQR